MPPTPDLSFTGLDDLANEPVVENYKAMSSEEEPKVVRKNDDALIIEEYVSDDEEEDVSQPKIKKKIVRPSIVKKEFVKSKQQEKSTRKTVKQVEQHRQNTHSPRGNQINGNNMMSQKLGSNFEMFNKAYYGNPQIDLHDQGVIDSGCSRHMTGNMSYLINYEEIDGGYVAFRGNSKGGKVTGKGTIKTGNLDFENVYFVRELKFNLFRENHRKKLIDESQVLLRVPRKNNMYSVDLKNIVPKGGLTCLFTKATSDESKLWHRRLEAVNTACYVQNRVLVVKPHNKTPYELFHGRTPTLSFMRPFRYHVTILNTIDHLGKFDGKADEGFFVGYSLNSKAFRVFNSRTRIVEENLHIRFSENTPNVVGSGLNFLFDIDALTRTMNYEPIVAITQSNDFAGPKSSHDDGSKPSSDDGKKVDEDPRKDSECNNQEKEDNVNSTNNVNAASTNEVNAINDGAEADMNNLDTTIQVSHNLTTRIHKDHPLDQVIGDLKLATQKTKMSKNSKENWKNPKRQAWFQFKRYINCDQRLEKAAYELPIESVFKAWERFKSCLRKCLDHKILLLNQILTFYYGITMIDQERLLVAAGDSDESDDDEPSEMIEDQKSIHHLSGSPTPSSDPVVVSLSPSLTPTRDSDSILEETDTLLPHHDSTSPEVNDDKFNPEGDILFLEGLLNDEISSNLPPIELNNDPEGDILFLENLFKDEPLEANKSEINPLIRESPNTFLMRDEEIKLNSHEDIDDLFPISRVFEKPLDSLDCISNTFDMTVTDPLFDFYSEFTLNSDNPIFSIHNEESDES
ncbi:ribonuclease H-like domain-containing protein [Tanacetum coccineum]